MRNADETEFGALVVPLLDCLQRQARQLEGSRSGADDLVQDTLERALRSFGRFVRGSCASAWLRTIMRNAFLDRARRRRFERPTDPSRLSFAERAASPEAIAPWRWVCSQDLDAALDRLPRRLREILALYREGVRSYRALARRLDISVGTVGTRLFRARRAARPLLEGRLAGQSAAGPRKKCVLKRSNQRRREHAIRED